MEISDEADYDVIFGWFSDFNEVFELMNQEYYNLMIFDYSLIYKIG
jgi:hypothetical protein